MGTDRSPELIQQIADATSFNKMREGKANSLQKRGDVRFVLYFHLHFDVNCKYINFCKF